MILHLDGLAFLVIHQSAMSINLSYMQLRGIISISIGKIAKTGISPMHVLSPMPLPNHSDLRALYLRANNLLGGIPSSIGNVSLLTLLELSSNSFGCATPSSLGRLTLLHCLNLLTDFFLLKSQMLEF